MKQIQSLARKLAPISENPRIEAELIYAKALGVTREVLLASSEQELIADNVVSKVQQMTSLRLKHYPLQYILGRVSFYNREFDINEQLLIPRSDTEMLVKYAVNFVRSRGIIHPKILDMGCGSGVIGISIYMELAKHGIDAQLTLSDISAAAIAATEKNAIELGVTGALYYESDAFESIPTSEKYDLIVSNPPYLPKENKNSWQAELDFEPESALISGKDGFDVYRKIFARMKSYMTEGASFIGEFDSTQNELMSVLCEEYELDYVLKPDLSGIVRFVQTAN